MKTRCFDCIFCSVHFSAPTTMQDVCDLTGALLEDVYTQSCDSFAQNYDTDEGD